MIRYRLLLLLLFLPLLGFTLIQAMRYGSLRYLWQRLGLGFIGLQRGGLWCHAASVGEVNAIRPLLLKLLEAEPTLTITLSSNTPTSADIVRKTFPTAIRHVYLPLDYRFAMRRLLKALQPRLCLVVETELWPNLYRLCHRRHVPIVLVNGRLSEKTLRAPGWIKRLYRRALGRTHGVLARSETDAVRFMAMGAAKDKVHVVGNIKMALPLDEQVEPVSLEREYLLAASTRDEEETSLVEAWLQLDSASRPLLVMVPRHPHRLGTILQQLDAYGLQIAVRSRGEPVTDSTDIYIADTIGELKSFIAGARLVIMGGSFVEKGGQNILEVAQQGKAVVFGPSMDNFADEARLFIEANAARQVELATLPGTLEELLADPHKARELGENAKALLVNGQQVLDEYLDLIRQALAREK